MNAADLISGTKSRPAGFNAPSNCAPRKAALPEIARACHRASERASETSQLSTVIRAITHGEKNKNEQKRTKIIDQLDHRTAAYRNVAYRKSRRAHLSLARLVEKRLPAVGQRRYSFCLAMRIHHDRSQR